MKPLELEPGRRYEVALKYRSYKPRKTESGAVEYELSLTSGEKLIVPPVAVDEIKALNPAIGECFNISRSIGIGNATVWSVERIPNSGQPPQPKEPAPVPKPMAAARSLLPRSAPPGSAAPVTAPPSLTTRESIRIFNQLVATIQAAQAAEQFAGSIGFPVKFGSEDIRAMAISGFIEQSRRAA